MPRRIQRSRAKGWRMPEGAIYVGRPSAFANPFRVGGYFKIGERFLGLLSMAWSERCIWKPADKESALREGYTLIVSRERSLDWYRRYAEAFSPERLEVLRSHLRGHDLSCWCALCSMHRDTGLALGVECADCTPCHVDILLPLVNAEMPRVTGVT